MPGEGSRGLFTPAFGWKIPALHPEMLSRLSLSQCMLGAANWESKTTASQSGAEHDMHHFYDFCLISNFCSPAVLSAPAASPTDLAHEGRTLHEQGVRGPGRSRGAGEARSFPRRGLRALPSALLPPPSSREQQTCCKQHLQVLRAHLGAGFGEVLSSWVLSRAGYGQSWPPAACLPPHAS